MENRLQFRHHTPIFETREEALDYIKIQVRRAEEGLASNDPSYGFSLLAEPTILRYKNEEDETDPHVIFVIGSVTNESGQYNDNRFCVIDIDKTESEIAEFNEALEKAIMSLTLVASDTNTVALTSEKTKTGTTLSADVKLAPANIFDDIRRPNSIMATENGLFMYVNMTYDAETDTIKFIVNGDVLDVRLSNSKLASGFYDKKDESLHLVSNDGSEVVVDCEELISEWGVEGEASVTPVVLTKEELGYGSDDEHHHLEPWQDVLKADVRLKDEQKIIENGTVRYVKDENSSNILNRTTDGRYLYVDGNAKNIIYYDNGEKSNVKAMLDKLNKIKLSPDNDNIIENRTDGFFSSVQLDYIQNENTLVLRTSGGHDEKRIKLNSVDLFKDVHFDATSEELVIAYVDGNGDYRIERIPLGEMLTDWEWEPQNEAHNVEIVKARHTAGNDKVSADVKLYDDENNILVDRNHSLFVNGKADNIKYGDGSNVKEALDELYETAGTIKLSEEVEDGRKNIIKLNADGIYANVDLSYVKEANKLIFHTSGEDPDKEILLDGLSDILDMRYDPETEELVIQYIANGSENKELRVPVRGLINEWRPSENTDGAIILTKEKNADDTQDVLSAEVIINTTHDDNALVNDHGSLYVGANNIVEKSTVFQCLSAETKAVEALLGVDGECGEEIAYPSDDDSILSGATTYAEADQILADAIAELAEGLDVELIGAETDTVIVDSYLNDEEKRVVEANVKLQGGGDDAVVDDNNALAVVENEGLYLSKTWNCGEYDDSDSDDISDDDSYMNYKRLNPDVEPEPEPEPTPDRFNGHDYVDLGLPSGTLWATMNVGADAPESTGLFYAWGDTYGHTKEQGLVENRFGWDTYKFNQIADGEVMNKYNDGDGKLVLESVDDAARVNMGGDWMMPTLDQINELVGNTENEWVDDYNGTGVRGYKFVNNGNTLFIPVFGWLDNGDILGEEIVGRLWLSNLSQDDITMSNYFQFELTGKSTGTDYRRCGMQVRGVINASI